MAKRPELYAKGVESAARWLFGKKPAYSGPGFFSGAANTAGGLAVKGGALYGLGVAGINWVKKNLGKFALGVSVLAIAAMALKGTARIVKKAAGLAVLAFAAAGVGYVGYRHFFNQSSAPWMTPSTSPEDNALKLAGRGIKSIMSRAPSLSDIGSGILAKGSSLLDSFKSVADNPINRIGTPFLAATAGSGIAPQILQRSPFSGIDIPAVPKSPNIPAEDAAARRVASLENTPKLLDTPNSLGSIVPDELPGNLPAVNGRTPISVGAEPYLNNAPTDDISPKISSAADSAPRTSETPQRISADGSTTSPIDAASMAHDPDRASHIDEVNARQAPALTEEATESRILTAAEAGDETAQALKAQDLAAEVAEGGSAALGKEVRNVTKLAKLRSALNVPGPASVAFGSAMFALNTYAFSLQRKYIQALANEGKLSDDPTQSEIIKNEYLKISDTNQNVLNGDIIVSSVDPTGLTIVASMGAEGYTYNNFNNWRTNYASHLDQDTINGLSMSLFTPKTIDSQLTEQIQHNIPDINQKYDPILEPTVIAKQEMLAIANNMPTPSLSTLMTASVSPIAAPHMKTADHVEWETQLGVARENFLQEISKLTETTAGTNAYLNLMDPSARIDVINDLAASDKSSNFEQNHPLVAAHLEAKNQSNWLSRMVKTPDATEALSNNAPAMNNYIMNRLGLGDKTSPPTPAPSRPVRDMIASANAPTPVY